MMDADVRYCSALFCLYALFEFLIRRVFLSSAQVREAPVKRAAARAVVLFLLMGLGSSGFLSPTLAIGFAAIAALYFLYEVATGRTENSEWALERFLLKQLLFAFLLFILWRLARPITLHEWYVRVENFALSGPGGVSDAIRERATVILTIAAAYLFVIDGGTRIVRGVFNKFPGLYALVVTKLDRRYSGETEENVGEWIGVLERLIALTFVLTGSYAALGFAFAAKSIARFKELEDKQFAEYYILGTSVSLLVALFAGLAVKVVFGF
jgi:hypothetical protein